MATRRTPSRSSLLFLFHGDGDSTDSREPDLIAFHLGDEAAINEVVMPLVASFAAIFFGELDAVALNLIDCADMGSVRSNNFHVFFDLGHRRPLGSFEKKLLAVATSQRAIRRSIRLRLLPTFLTAFFTADADLRIFFPFVPHLIVLAAGDTDAVLFAPSAGLLVRHLTSPCCFSNAAKLSRFLVGTNRPRSF